MKIRFILILFAVVGCRTDGDGPTTAFRKELNAIRIELPNTPGMAETTTVEKIAACIQSRANAVLPPASSIRILVVIPNLPVREESFIEPESNVFYLDQELPVGDVLWLYSDLCGFKTEYAPKSRTIIWYQDRQPTNPPYSSPATGLKR